jgi:hypothetical protein
MLTSLLTLRVRSRRDILVARQRARQIAGLLRFSPRRQYAIGAAVFEIALNLTHQPGGGSLQFELHDETLHVGARDRHLQVPGLHSLSECVPDPEQLPAREDLPWLIEQLMWYTPLNLFEEIRQHNRALLDALQALETPEGASHRAHREEHHPAA